MLAMPRITGPGIAGLPGGGVHGFLPIDKHCRVPRTGGRVFAAGDAANYPIKHGGVGAQMADAAASAIAVLAGVLDKASAFDPVIRGKLLTGADPVYMSARPVGAHSFESEVFDAPRGLRTRRSWQRSSGPTSRDWTRQGGCRHLFVGAGAHSHPGRPVPGASPEEAMRSPELYPGRPEAVEVVESHISWVFLAGDRAYKLRKPVVFPFLDYGTAERRREMCEAEVRLGRRLAPDLYLGVRPLVRSDDGWSLGEPGERGDEHVVEMRRFDESSTLAARLARGDADAALVRAVARRIAKFHSAAEPAPAGSFDAGAVAATVSENFGTLLPYAEAVGARELAAAHRFAVAFLHARHDQLEDRGTRGFVRDCHGDLRAEHVIVADGAVEVFDPLEFDPELRQIDVSADLAFLVMDLVVAGADELAGELIAEYEAAGGDHGGRQLLFFYAAYRAWVRAKVACLRAGELPPGERAGALAEARRFAEHRPAARVASPPALVLVVCGAAATGKTYLAEELASLSGLPRLSSDVVRKELAGLGPTERAPQAMYSEDANLRTYRELGARAAAAADGAIVDATFRRRAHRAAFAEAFGGRALFVECIAPAAVVAERARRRELDPERVSDATPAIAARQRSEFEPLDEVAPEAHLAAPNRPPGGRAGRRARGLARPAPGKGGARDMTAKRRTTLVAYDGRDREGGRDVRAPASPPTAGWWSRTSPPPADYSTSSMTRRQCPREREALLRDVKATLGAAAELRVAEGPPAQRSSSWRARSAPTSRDRIAGVRRCWQRLRLLHERPAVVVLTRGPSAGAVRRRAVHRQADRRYDGSRRRRRSTTRGAALWRCPCPMRLRGRCSSSKARRRRRAASRARSPQRGACRGAGAGWSVRAPMRSWSARAGSDRCAGPSAAFEALLHEADVPVVVVPPSR